MVRYWHVYDLACPINLRSLLACIHLFRHGKLPVFVDCTFFCVPHGFYQLLIIVVFVPAYNLYVPVWFILLDGKHEAIYDAAFAQVRKTII